MTSLAWGLVTTIFWASCRGVSSAFIWLQAGREREISPRTRARIGGNFMVCSCIRCLGTCDGRVAKNCPSPGCGDFPIGRDASGTNQRFKIRDSYYATQTSSIAAAIFSTADSGGGQERAAQPDRDVMLGAEIGEFSRN